MNTLQQEKDTAAQQAAGSRSMWQLPWGYRESFAVVGGLLAIGFALQVATQGSDLQAPPFPVNAALMLGMVTLTTLLHLAYRTHPFVKWLRSVPASIAAIAALLLLVVIMGTIPQAHMTGVQPDLLGFNHMMTSWPFALVNLFFLLTLAMTTLNRLIPFQWKNWGFVANHLGLWIAVVAGTLGAGDLQRLSMTLTEGGAEWRATDGQGRVHELPIAIRLKDFRMEEFLPKLAFVDNQTGKVLDKGLHSMEMIRPGQPYEYNGYRIEVTEYLPEAGRVSDALYAHVNEEGAAPAARVQVKHLQTGRTIEGWLSCGSFRYPFEALKVDEAYSLLMTRPEPKKYASDVEFFTPEGKVADATVEVNKPQELEGYKIYQLSYDDRFGRWSKTSVLELVRDPWLPVVYFGILLMTIGALQIMWVGSREK